MANTCLEQTLKLADAYELSIDPPDAFRDRPSDRAASDGLAGSEGVIEAPPDQSPAVIAPPGSAGNSMPTLPDVPSDTPPVARQENKASSGLSVSDRTTLETVLLAARAAARRGEEKSCFDRLSKAKAYIQRQRRG